jgi:putative nucleotidyltransferase with HDIG domain
MSDGAPTMDSYLPQAVAATALVVAAPALAVWLLRSTQLVSSTPLAVVIGAALSMTASLVGSAYWVRTRRSRDVLFSELMLWGWLRRRRAERRLTAALTHLHRLTDERRDGDRGQAAVVRKLARALEAGDPYTRGHSRRVARYAVLIARKLGLPAAEVDRIRTAAAVHDVGKVETPLHILHKPGRLTDEEYTIVKRHPVAGARLVQALGDEELTAIVRHHHERLDGHGYPGGLSGNAIPLGARIIAVADTFDAITSARPYRAASPHRRALAILAGEVGTQLDADAVRAFRICYAGRRPPGLWLTLAALPSRLLGRVTGSGAGNAVSMAKVVAAASTAAVVGGAVASAAPLRAWSPAPSRLDASRTTDGHHAAVGAPSTATVQAGAPRPLLVLSRLSAAPARLGHVRGRHAPGRHIPITRAEVPGHTVAATRSPATATRWPAVAHASRTSSHAPASPVRPASGISTAPATPAPSSSPSRTAPAGPGPSSTTATQPPPTTAAAPPTTPTATTPPAATQTPVPTTTPPAPTTSTPAPTVPPTSGATGHPGTGGGPGNGGWWGTGHGPGQGGGGGDGGGRGRAGDGH